MKAKDYFKLYLKERIGFLLLQMTIIILFSAIIILFGIDFTLMIWLIIVFFSLTFFTLLIDFISRKKYYQGAYEALEKLDQKELFIELLEVPEFLDGKIMYDFLKQTSKAMNDKINLFQVEKDEYREYIEAWVHEVKIPLAAGNMICTNNSGELSDKIQKELLRIDNYLEQALYYARSTSVEKDYLVKEIKLEELVKNTVKHYAGQLIELKSIPKFQNLNHLVYSDSKWLEFIIGQMIANSIKYRKESMEIILSAEEIDNSVVLSIRDKGMGISAHDIDRIFDKGFTGENVRYTTKSTGMGLYISKKLCDKLRLNLRVESTYGEGTTFFLTFPKDKRSLLKD